MLQKISIQIIVLFLFSIFSSAQNFELGKVSIEELREKSNAADTAAVATILFEKGRVHFNYSQEEGFTVFTEVETRIKIYKKEGFDWANKKVRYSLDNHYREQVRFSNAVTYNLVGGGIEKTKIKSDGEFDEKVNKYWGYRKIAMPNIKEGSVIEYKYIIKSPASGSLKDWNFQTSIPVNYSQFEINVPEYFIFKPIQKGSVFPKVEVKNNRRNINYVYAYNQENGNPPSRSHETLDFAETKTIYTASNLKAMKDEAYVNNIENYTSSVSHELARIDYPNQPSKLYSTNWESVAKIIYDDDDFGTELNKTGYFENDLNTLINKLSSPEEKLNAIFNYVKESLKWNKFYGYSCNDGVKKAYKEKTGNVAEVNLILTAMLRFSGLDANPVLVSTRSNGITIFPNRTAFNYVIAGVKMHNEIILLDATEKFSSPDILPLRDLNWFGRLIRKDGTSEEINLMPKNVSRKQTFINYVLSDNRLLTGKIRNQYTNHEALDFRNSYLDLTQDDYLEKLENKNNGIEVGEYSRQNEKDLEKPLVEIFSFKDTKDIEIINDKIYLAPLIFMTKKENPFKQEEREYPIDFGYPYQDKTTITMEIPEGYIVESIPEPINISIIDGIGSFKYLIENNGKTIQVLYMSEINNALVPSEYYPVLKEFFQKRIDKQNEKIVLKKG